MRGLWHLAVLISAEGSGAVVVMCIPKHAAGSAGLVSAATGVLWRMWGMQQGEWAQLVVSWQTWQCKVPHVCLRTPPVVLALSVSATDAPLPLHSVGKRNLL